jgi:condensin complex subunit 1
VALQRLNGSAKKVKGICDDFSFHLDFHHPSGSLLDKTLRMEMNSPIFHRLQDAIECPCRSKEWFGVAEQAINTIYALGEHPDVLCNEVIRNLTVRAFDRKARTKGKEKETETDGDREDGEEDREESEDGDDQMDTQEDGEKGKTPTQEQEDQEKDTGDSFELSQLLFVVGHVAIKHIVFLELVEREWKRQKDEKQTGKARFPYPSIDLRCHVIQLRNWLLASVT